MLSFEETIQDHFEERARTLARIKARSVGADTLTLTALSVLVYAQLEGGVKDLAACVIKDLNVLRPQVGKIRPELLAWRNPEAIEKFKAKVDFEMIAAISPFASELAVPFQLKPINRRYELNQMGWGAIANVYTGLGLDRTEIDKLKTKIDEIVEDRNQAAHHGAMPAVAANFLESQVREKVDVVETVLTDLCIQLLPFFASSLHAR